MRIFRRAMAALLLLLLAFVFYMLWHNRPLPQNEYDIAILRRAQELLVDEVHWARDDDRSCELSSETLSLYCALQRASMNIAGEFRHRAASLQAVRRAIDAARPGHDYTHRLMDFNNDPEVSFQELHGAIMVALEDLEAVATSDSP